MSLLGGLCLLLFQITSIFLCLGLTFGQQDCDNNACCLPGGHKEINDPRRSINSILEAGQSAICDRALAWGWYRFTSYVGGKMPTTKVEELRCGTIHPIWMKSPHPLVAEGTVDRKACINFFGLSDGCFTQLDIKVRNCGEHYVYYLGPTFSCSLAYCAGYETPCPYGEVGQPPNCTEPPQEFDRKYLGDPVIEYKEEEDQTIRDSDPTAVSLLCKVQLLHGVETWDNVTYKIEWFSEGKRLQDPTSRCQVASGVRKHDAACPDDTLLVSQLVPGGLYKPGMWISCNVSAKFTNSVLNKWTIPKQVKESFYAGIKVYPATLRLASCDKPLEGGNKITIEPTIPVRRNPTRPAGNKDLTVTFALPSGLTLKDGVCKLTLSDLNRFEVEVVPDCPLQDDGKTRVIIVEVKSNGAFWLGTLRSIWVSIIRSDLERCKTFTDPHYYAMDKMTNYRHFDFFGHGDFLLYRNLEKNFEIHTRQWTCNRPGITCNCAAVLRDHNDVIEFNCCNKDLELQNEQPTPLQIKIRSEKCLRPGISLRKKIEGSNTKYVVMFPTGVKVDLVRNYWGIDVTVITTRADPQLEAGLCLYDFTEDINTFGEDQRMHLNESFFETLPPTIDDTGANYATPCTCTTEGPHCGQNPINIPSFLRDKTTAFNLCDRAFKRGIHYSDDLTDEDYELLRKPLQPHHHHRFKRAIPAPVVSKENATRYCTDKIAETEVGKLCAEVGVNVQAYVNSCSVDIELTGEYSFAIGIVSLLMSECGYVAAINSTQHKNGSSGEEESSSSIGNEIAELLCPNDCTFNGKCVNATCVCNKDYTADDCSISIYQKPSISRLQGDGLCDKRIRPCKKVTVMGVGWLNSTNITCHLVEFKVVNSSWTPNKTELRFPGIMTDLVLVDCHLPDSPVKQGHFDENIEGTPAAGITISVSNDGIHKSNENLTFISYDSACMTCNVSTGCSLKNNSCFINRYCFAANEVNPNDWCSQCLPDVNTNAWSQRRVNHPPTVTSKLAYYALPGENLELTIDTVDPEGMPVTISLMDGSPKEAVLKADVIYWNVTGNTTTTFYLKATDSCLNFSTFNFTVSLVACPCKNNGRCSPVEPRGSGYYLCTCADGFTGATCETNIDECQSYPCLQGRCVDGTNNYTCLCDAGYEGRNCDHDHNDCASSPCINGTCADQINGYICNCDSGYTGPQCDEEVDECQSSPCFHGTCFDRVGNYYCHCEDGYTGRECDLNIDECHSSPCVNGTCVDKVNGFDCSCQTGFSGIRCEVDINDCLSVSCGNGTCTDHLNNYSCICNVGFTGWHCDILITECSNTSCYPNVPCTENDFTISCGFCPSGFTGDGKNCKDIDDCVNHTCANAGSCVDGLNNYSCNCLPGYTGVHCEADIDDCVNHTCRNNGSCVDGVNNFSCNCTVGFTGDYCETDTDDCVNHTCSNGGSCQDGTNSYSCNCLEGFTGDLCETEIDNCVNHTCHNGGSCVNGASNYSCNCSAGYTGDHCETELESSSVFSVSTRDTTTHTMISSGISTTILDTATNGATITSDTASTTSQETSFTPSVKVSATLSSVITDIPTTDKDDTTTTVQPTTEQPESRLASSSISSTRETSTQAVFSSRALTTTLATATDILSITSATASSSSKEISFTSSLKGSATLSSARTDIPTTDKEDTTTTVQPTTEQPETKLIVELRIQWTWNEDLENRNTEAFKNLSLTFETLIRELYSQDKNFDRVTILSFRPGSVVAEFELLFKNRLEDEQALAPLKNGMEDGKMGPLDVYPDSLKIIEQVEEPTQDDKRKIPYPIIIGVSCGGIFVLTILSVYLIRYCKRGKKVSRRRSGVIPAEVPFPNPEKYELQETESKEDVVRYEEIGLWNDTVPYEALQILPDAVQYAKLGFTNAAICQEVGIPSAAGDYQEIAVSKDAGDYQEIGNLNDALRYQ